MTSTLCKYNLKRRGVTLWLTAHVTMWTCTLVLSPVFPFWEEVMWTFFSPLHHSSWAAPERLHMLSSEQPAVWVSRHTMYTHTHTHTITQMVIWGVRIRARCERSQRKAAPPSSLLRIGGDWNFLYNVYRMNTEYNSFKVQSPLKKQIWTHWWCYRSSASIL